MAPKRGRQSGGNQRQYKRKKLNLATLQEQIKQKKFYRNQGQPTRPADGVEGVTTRSKNKVENEVVEEQDERAESSASDSEDEAPVIQQLLQEIGVQEEEPESEQDSEDEEDLIDDEEEDLDEQEGEGDEDDEDFSDVNGASFLDDETVENDNESDIENGDIEGEEDEGMSEDEENSEENEGEEESGNEEEDSDYDEEEKESDDEGEESDEEGEESDEEEESEEERSVGLDKEDRKAMNGLNGTKKLKKKTKPLDISSDEGDSDKDDADDLNIADPFTVHFEREVEVDEFLEKNKEWTKKEIKVPGIGKSLFSYRDTDFLRAVKSSTDLKGEHVKHKLCNKVSKTNAKFVGVDLKEGGPLTKFQYDLFNVLNTYQDLLYSKQSVRNGEEIRLVYCLHALNHVLKTRSRIISNDFKLRQGEQCLNEDLEYRDQGLTRPTVLIMLPYREKAKKVVNILIHLLSASEKVKAGSLKRFLEDFSEAEKTDVCGSSHKAEDYVQLFEGNIDDNFLIGLSVSKSSLKLYTKRYGSDIILASPLGLRSLISATKEKRDFEFLSSIEMLIMDQSDVYMMQNWDHVVHSLQHFHLQPKASHNVDFSRVRMWAIDGLSKYFRQTIMFSNVLLPEFISVFNKYCHNYSGKIMVEKNEKVGSLRSCLTDVPQVFHRVACSKPDGISQRNAKLEYFKTKLLYLHNAAGMRRTLIYCNYFSFVTLRNLFREEGLAFLFINEYDDEKEIKKSRRKFRQGLASFLLHTERLHFHHRCRLRGACHIVWFDLPQYPVFYPELVNLLEITKQACTSTCLFTKYEGQKLMEIVGQKNASHMLNSEKTVNMITLS